MTGKGAMRNELSNTADQAKPIVAVWTPWGEQRVPRVESRGAILQRIAQRARDSDAAPSDRLAMA